MKYNPNAASGVEVIFERQIDVQTVREAFRENAERLKSLGNDSSISDYQKWVAQWTGDS
jgi:formate dehydrogenase maturation protein FdhE